MVPLDRPQGRPGQRGPSRAGAGAASGIARMVAHALRLGNDPAGVAIVESAIERRTKAAYSDIAAERVELADWLIRESGTDAPGAIDLWVAAANDGVRELGRERGWDDATVDSRKARLAEAFEVPLRRALVEEQPVE